MSLRTRLKRLERASSTSTRAEVDEAITGFLRLIHDDPRAAQEEAKGWTANSPEEARLNAEIVALLEVA